MSDLRQLRYFVTLAETLNYGRAAAQLNITQPPLSRQIAALEKRLGVRLFARHHYGVSLTEAGKSFHDDAQAVIEAYQQACRNARLTAIGEKGTLSIGFMMHAAYSTIPELTRQMLTAYPDVKLLLHEATPGVLVKAVLDGAYDAGLVFQTGKINSLNNIILHQEKLCLAVNQQHPLAQRERIIAEDLRNEPLIVTPHAAAPVLREMIDIFLLKQGVEPYYRLETQLQQTIISFVAEGLGSALVPESVKKLNYAGVMYRPVEESPVIEQALIWRKDNKNPVLTSFTQTAARIFNDDSPSGARDLIVA
ncbi:DNA-binding transcriptional LysR family regulator [Raoultella sp. BIGb0138]|uniref:LysR substrate-binding domain-containing protein n=1 Tax=Raoultella sp. BIGb0138 TaxID=2485115 RepID=UPI00104D6BCB|nr:LysR substrate-binding domain-containing protein [Raoultella sp. BIGb0138]TCW14364.1 DNA-binding transcriptional LysR family regulator [Raoultella sp. BIGb0138]